MHCLDEGTGDALLFAHGAPTWSFEYRHLIAAHSPRHRCIAPDHLGFGLSDRPPNANYSPEAHADRLQKLVAHLGLERFTLVAHDYGGPIALPLALADRPPAERLILMNTWMWPLEDDADVARKGRLAAGWLGRLLYKYANASLRILTPSAFGDRSKLTRAIHRQYLEVFRDREARVLVLHALARAILSSSAFYARLYAKADRLRRIPTLIVWGMKDIAFQAHQLARWRMLLPDAEVCELASAGHWPHEEEPEAVNRALARFLTRDEESTARPATR